MKSKRRPLVSRASMAQAAVIAGLASAAAPSAPISYTIDPNHTHPLFEADHFNGLSTWRGLFRKSSGTVTLDGVAQTGWVDISIEVASVGFGHDRLNEIAVKSIFEADKYPLALYRGTLKDFVNGAPTSIEGTLTLHGVSMPLVLYVDSFKCISNHPLLKREVCGADVSGSLNRADYGITIGQQYGFTMKVGLRIQVEGIKAD